MMVRQDNLTQKGRETQIIHEVHGDNKTLVENIREDNSMTQNLTGRSR